MTRVKHEYSLSRSYFKVKSYYVADKTHKGKKLLKSRGLLGFVLCLKSFMGIF
jgi:hypothetical protein